VTNGLLAAIVALTVCEIAGVVLVMVFGPRDQATVLTGVLVGIVGPVVASLLAVWHAADAKQQVQNLNQRLDTWLTGKAAPPAGEDKQA
jgi:uncharacterized membrane protein YeaQ/YmgE (transglycosylase-associated protein family)